MTESYALTHERNEQDRNPDRRSHLSVAREEWTGDGPLGREPGPDNRCDMCGNWQAPEVGARCDPCINQIHDERNKEWWT